MRRLHVCHLRRCAVGLLLTLAVLFEDETARIATGYRVVASPSLSTLPPHANMSGYNQADFLPPADSLVEGQKLSHFNEAFLLRHFRNALATWVRPANICIDRHLTHAARRVQRRRPLLSRRGRTRALMSPPAQRLSRCVCATPLEHNQERRTRRRRRVSRAVHCDPAPGA
jgi:hypothetical protein